MKIVWRIAARFSQVRAARLRARARLLDARAEKFFRRVKGRT